MSLLNAQQRAVARISADHVDPLVMDRCVEAYDALIERGDLDEYQRLMLTAHVQMGYPKGVVPPQDRPTALDKCKTICVYAYAKRERMTYMKAVQRLRRMLQG